MMIRRDASVTLSMRECQFKLALLWLGIAAVLFLIMILQTFQDRYLVPEQAWSWFVPTLIPTISVIVGGIVHSASTAGKDFEVEARIYDLAFLLSVAYLVLVAASVLLAGPYQVKHGGNVQAWLQMSKLWLTPLEAPVGIALGVFFTSSRPSSAAAARGGEVTPAPAR
jgi:hypothetical protein